MHCRCWFCPAHPPPLQTSRAMRSGSWWAVCWIEFASWLCCCSSSAAPLASSSWHITTRRPPCLSRETPAPTCPPQTDPTSHCWAKGSHMHGLCCLASCVLPPLKSLVCSLGSAHQGCGSQRTPRKTGEIKAELVSQSGWDGLWSRYRIGTGIFVALAPTPGKHLGLPLF